MGRFVRWIQGTALALGAALNERAKQFLTGEGETIGLPEPPEEINREVVERLETVVNANRELEKYHQARRTSL